MKATRFFRFVWRMNAVLILLGSVLAVLAVSIVLIGELHSLFRRAAIPDTTPQVRTASGRRLTLGRFSIEPGTEVARATLVEESSGKDFSSSSTGDARNILFVDLSSGESTWLLPTHDQELSREVELHDPAASGHPSVPLANVFLVHPVGSKPDAAGRLLLTGPAGRPVTELATGVTALPDQFVHSAARATLLVERLGSVSLLELDLRAFTKREEVAIPLPELSIPDL